MQIHIFWNLDLLLHRPARKFSRFLLKRKRERRMFDLGQINVQLAYYKDEASPELEIYTTDT